MTRDERVRALQGFGYTPRQAAFLELVAVHSGHFLRRHYPSFLGRAHGAVTATFLDALIARGHAKRQTYYRRSHVYHLCARPLYAAIDEANSRHRRTRPPFVITRKLMTLDVVLGHRDRTFLATEREKVTYFTEQRGVLIEALPHRDYCAKDSRDPVTTRYFVDRTPICLTPSTPDLSFVYLGYGESTSAGLETFLTEHARLFRQLKTVRVVYVIGPDDPTSVLPDRFRRAVQGAVTGRRVSVDDASIAVLRGHFRARQRLDQRRWTELSHEDLDRLRRDVRRFSGPEYDAWYQRWCAEGDTALRDFGPVVDPSAGGFEPTFDVWHIPHRYGVTGTGDRSCR